MFRSERLVPVDEPHQPGPGVMESLEQRFTRIMQREGPGLRRVAASYAARTSEGDDLLQEIALAVWRSLPSFRGDCSERTFAFRIAHNRGLSFASRRADSPVDEPLEPPRSSSDPERQLEGEQERGRLWRAIHRLRPAPRAIVTLALEGLSHREIADVVGISVNNVAVRLSRARDDLRRALEEEP